jgi:phosphoglycolate phosphatase
MYTTVLFDLDGTLTDPYVGISNSVKYALHQFGIIEADQKRLKLFIGPPLEKSFMAYYRLSPQDAKKAVTYYREYFSQTGMYENTLYDGIETVLQTLHDSGITCIVATSKLEIYAIQIVQHFNIDSYFTHIIGSNQEGTLSEKGDILRHIIAQYALKKQETIMVGDRKYDIIGAKENGIDSIGVLYGYGSEEELEEIQPTYRCRSVAALLNYL